MANRQPDPGQIPKNDSPSNWNPETLKEYFDQRISAIYEKIESYDRRYQEKFEAQNTAVTKAETAQSTYNQGHNDLIRKMESMVTTSEFNAERQNSEKWREKNEADIRILRESKSGIAGKGEGKTDAWQYLVAAIGAIVGVIGIIAFIISQVKK